MRALIVGYGSIGKRHAKVLSTLGCEVALVTAQIVSEYTTYPLIVTALANESVDYVIIANSTNLHYDALMQCIAQDYRGIVLVEKPLYAQNQSLPEHHIQHLLVAYNLRFNELLFAAKKMLSEEEIISFSVEVGQYLPTWRKNIDYQNCYSAKKTLGGGVLRDLSHELDYIQWICGSCMEVSALGGKHSDLAIDSDDIYSILMCCEKAPIVNVQLNYLYREARRNIIVQTKKHTFVIDLLKGILSVDGEIKLNQPQALQESYLKEHQALIEKNFHRFCSYEEGVDLVKLIEAVEQSAFSRRWINL